MGNINVNDKFMNPARLGEPLIPFKLKGCSDTKGIPRWRINRSNARSMGKATFLHTKTCKCGSNERRVYNNTCYPCFKLSENK